MQRSSMSTIRATTPRAGASLASSRSSFQKGGVALRARAAAPARASLRPRAVKVVAKDFPKPDLVTDNYRESEALTLKLKAAAKVRTPIGGFRAVPEPLSQWDRPIALKRPSTEGVSCPTQGLALGALRTASYPHISQRESWQRLEGALLFAVVCCRVEFVLALCETSAHQSSKASFAEESVRNDTTAADVRTGDGWWRCMHRRVWRRRRC